MRVTTNFGSFRFVLIVLFRIRVRVSTVSTDPIEFESRSAILCYVGPSIIV